MASGERVLLIADDPMARVDVPYFVADQAHLLIGRREEGAALHFLIEKT
jgi:tRNA 2-thiouridine synthesizing protein A